MSPRELLISIVAGAVAAMMALAVLSLSAVGMMLFQFAQLPLFLVGLAFGAKAAMVATLSLFLVTALATDFVVGLMLAALFGLSATIVIRQALLRRGDGEGGVAWYPPGGILTAVLGVAALAGALAMPSVVDLTPGEIARTLAAASETMKRMGSDAGDTQEGAQLIAGTLRFVPGLFATWLIVSLAINGALAQGALRRLGRALRPSPRMDALALPSWIAVLAAIVAVGAFFPGLTRIVAGNLVLVAAVAFLFAGLAAIHATLNATLADPRMRRFASVAVYLLLFSFAPALFAVVLLGVLEPWTRLRERHAGPAPIL